VFKKALQQRADGCGCA